MTLTEIKKERNLIECGIELGVPEDAINKEYIVLYRAVLKEIAESGETSAAFAKEALGI